MIAALAISALGAIGLAIGFAVDAQQTFAAYLIAFVFAATVTIGLLAFVMAAHAMSATWTTAIRRLCEAGVAVLPLLVVLFVPLCFSLDRLYPWMHPERILEPHVRALVEHKRPVMNAPFFLVRAFVFLLFWAAAGALLRRGSLRMDAPGAPDLRPRLRALSCALLPLTGITATFASFDWLMSLSPDFYSTMYGLYVLSGGFVAAVGLLAVVLFFAQRAGELRQVSRAHWYAIGRLLFAFLIFWAYTGFFQFLLIWIAGKPLEVKFYLLRIAPGDRWASAFLIFGHFGAPWLVALSYFVKRRRATVTLLGGWILACHYVDMHWLVGAHRGAFPWQWQDAAALAFVAGACVAFALWRQRGRAIAATGDPSFAAALAYVSK